MIKLLDEYGSQSSKSFNALRHAALYIRVDVVSYLLNKYTYPLNVEYMKMDSNQSMNKQRYTLLTELNLNIHTESVLYQLTELLIDHGADPDKPMCANTNANATMAAIRNGHLEVVAQYIRYGTTINVRSYERSYGKLLPFEASVLRGDHYTAEMLLISGCSCGMFSLDVNHKFKDEIRPEVEKLMKEWKVQENNVTPLKQRCRSVILNQLAPQASMKMEKLPLPGCLIKFLGIPELNDILDRYKEECWYL